MGPLHASGQLARARIRRGGQRPGPQASARRGLLRTYVPRLMRLQAGAFCINGSDGSNGDTKQVNGAITTTSSNPSDTDVDCNYGNPVTVAAPGEGSGQVG